MSAGQPSSFDLDALDLNPKALEGLTVVITGTLPNLSRKQVQELVERAGGKVTGSISSKTNLLIAGDKAGSKLNKAEELKIGVWNEVEFLTNIRRQAEITVCDEYEHDLSDTEEFLNSPLGKAFTRLNEEGIRSHSECGFANRDGFDAITSGGYTGPFVYFTEQDYWNLLEDDRVFISFGIADEFIQDEMIKKHGERVISILSDEGIRCQWNRDISTRIEAMLDYRQRDYVSFKELCLASYQGVYPDANYVMICIIVAFTERSTDKAQHMIYMNKIFNSTEEELRNTFLQHFKKDRYSQFYFEDYGLEQYFSDIEEFLEELDWNAIWKALNGNCDEDTIRKKIADYLEIDVLEVDFKKNVNVDDNSIGYFERLQEFKKTQKQLFDKNKKLAAQYLDSGCDKDDRKDFKGAIDDYTRVIELDTKNIEAYANRGCAREEIGDIKGALSDWWKAVSLGDKEAELWIRELENSYVMTPELELILEKVKKIAAHPSLKEDEYLIDQVRTLQKEDLTFLSYIEKQADQEMITWYEENPGLIIGGSRNIVFDITAEAKDEDHELLNKYQELIKKLKLDFYKSALALQIQNWLKHRSEYENNEVIVNGRFCYFDSEHYGTVYVPHRCILSESDFYVAEDWQEVSREHIRSIIDTSGDNVDSDILDFIKSFPEPMLFKQVNALCYSDDINEDSRDSHDFIDDEIDELEVQGVRHKDVYDIGGLSRWHDG